MYNRRFGIWASLLLVVMLVLSGCAPRAGAGTSAALATDPTQLVIDLPAIVVDINNDGSPSIGNVPVADLGRLANVDLSTLAVPTDWVNYFVSGNIQHIQVNNRADGLLMLVNGQPIPSVAWDGESLQATAETMSAFGVAIPMMEKLLPLVQRLGIGVIVRFPVAAGAETIPLYVEGDATAAAAAKKAQEEFLAAVGSPPRINLPVFYNADGSFAIGDLTDVEWSRLTNTPLYGLRLNPALIQSLSKSGVKSLTISTDPAGIHVTLNGKMLPTITWGNGELLHLIDVADQMQLWNLVAPNMNLGEVLATVKELLPVVQTADFDLNVFFPGAGMAVSR
jgi:hypothetical protein